MPSPAGADGSVRFGAAAGTVLAPGRLAAALRHGSLGLSPARAFTSAAACNNASLVHGSLGTSYTSNAHPLSCQRTPSYDHDAGSGLASTWANFFSRSTSRKPSGFARAYA